MEEHILGEIKNIFSIINIKKEIWKAMYGDGRKYFKPHI